jgi:DNA-binding NtrC family response regulator
VARKYHVKPIEVLFVEDNAGDTVWQWMALDASPRPVKFHLARDGEQALLMLHDRVFDLVVLDLSLPKLSGYDVLEQCARITPIVVFSGSSDAETARRSLELGAREFVTKPFQLEAYKETVRQIVQKWGRKPRPVIRRKSQGKRFAEEETP